VNWSPELTFTTWSTYTTPFGLQIGGGVRYVDTVARSINITDPRVTNTPTAPEYWVIDAMLAYEVNDKVTLQLNGYNLADEDYVAQLNNGGSRYIPGAPRSALLTVNFAF
jgi:catecholate siderophore receptor